MTARSSMTQRAVIQRDANLVRDDYGHKDQPQWTELAQIPCRFWALRGRRVLGPLVEAEVIDHAMIIPLGADVTIRDRVAKILDRRHNELVSRTMRILSIEPRKTHLALTLQEVGP